MFQRPARRVPINAVTFGQHLRYWRTIHHWTPEELAILCRHAQTSLRSRGRPITPAWIRMMEHRSDHTLTSIRRAHLEALALALDIPLESLCAAAVPADTPRPESALTLADILTWHEANHGPPPSGSQAPVSPDP